MTIIAFVSQKGGVGKSTLARAVAVEAQKQRLKSYSRIVTRNKPLVTSEVKFGGKFRVKFLIRYPKFDR
jgi:MinD superfamily P-loop ATPase